MPKVFEATDYLNQQGIKVTGAISNGVYEVETDDGKKGTLDLNEVLREQGIGTKGMQYEVNTPDSPLEVSPIGMVDRAKLALGNEAGKLEYLKKRYNEVKYVPEKGIVVRNHGIWQTVDPEGLGEGDAWERTKELAKDVIDLGDIALAAGASTAGAVGGATLGPVGAMGGAAAGGGVAETLRTSLGRLVGTYKATPQEQIEDIGIEAILNLGGEGLALGAKPALKGIANAFKNIGKAAPEASKEIIAQSLGKLTGVGSEATRLMMDNPDEVIANIAKAKRVARTTGEVVDNLADEQIKTGTQILEKAPEALDRLYTAKKMELAKAAAGMGEVNMGNVVKTTLNQLEQDGVLMSQELSNGKKIFKIIDDQTAVQRANAGLPTIDLSPLAQKELMPIINKLNILQNRGAAKGSEAAMQLLDLKKGVNAVARDYDTFNTTPATKRVAAQIKSSLDNVIGGQFEQHGLTDTYLNTMNVYKEFADVVDEARAISDNGKKTINFVQRIVADTKASKAYKDLTEKLIQLMPEAKEQFDSIQAKEVAKAFTPWLPRTGFTAQATLAGSALAGATINPVAGLAAAAATSPRLSLGATKMLSDGLSYGRKGLDLIQSLTPQQRFKLLEQPELLDTFIRTTFSAGQMQRQATEDLVKGAVQGGGQ
jgi:hypothetical protein